MASIVPELFRIYREAGYEPITGFSSYHFNNFRDAPFTIFGKDGQIFGFPDFGLALQEVMFIEHFRDYIAPKNVLVIGNSFGWSTVALALTFPGARTIAIDPNAAGVSVTNELINRNKLSALAVTGRSPDDVASAVRRESQWRRRLLPDRCSTHERRVVCGFCRRAGGRSTNGALSVA